VISGIATYAIPYWLRANQTAFSLAASNGSLNFIHPVDIADAWKEDQLHGMSCKIVLIFTKFF